jgi:hypothetical protein
MVRLKLCPCSFGYGQPAPRQHDPGFVFKIIPMLINTCFVLVINGDIDTDRLQICTRLFGADKDYSYAKKHV